MNMEFPKRWDRMKRTEYEREVMLPRSEMLAVVEQLQAEVMEKGISEVASQPREYIFERNITPAALKLLGQLPLECLLTDFKGDLHFETGSESTVPVDGRKLGYGAHTSKEAFFIGLQHMLGSRFSLHNHPPEEFGFASRSDVLMSREAASDIDFIVLPDGILGYKPDENNDYYSAPSDKRLDKVRRIGQLLKEIAQNPARTLREHKEGGALKFFVPFRGDEESRKKVELICDYMNNEDIKWSDVLPAIEAE